MVTKTVDVLVVGSGAAGLAAAIAAAERGARVVVLERTALLGGTTAVSGGVAWLPDAAAHPDFDTPREAALAYLGSLVPTVGDRELVAAYVDNASRVVSELHRVAGLELEQYPTPDYHPDLPGGLTGGRSHGPVNFAATAENLGPHLNSIRDAPFRMQWVNEAIAEKGWWQSGRALVGALVAGAHALGVEFLTERRAVRLLMDDGAVAGLVCLTPNGSDLEYAAGSVVLACGGFEYSDRLTEQHFGFAFDGSMSPPWNEGDGLAMALGAGADVGNLNGAWWFPVFHVDGERHDHVRAYHDTNRVRALPGTIVVNHAGRRFVDEARSYNIVGRAMTAFDPATASYPNRRAWIIFGDDFLSSHPGVAFGDLEPDARWLTSADTLAELAAATGIDADGLAATVETFEGDVAGGHDSQFQRGENYYDQYQGDRNRLGSVAASLGSLGPPRYHAIPLLLGVLGTKGGPRTDARGRVMDPQQRPIPGLYAAGNVASSVMRGAYPGGGASIGPALTFGFLAGQDAAAHSSESAVVGRGSAVG